MDEALIKYWSGALTLLEKSLTEVIFDTCIKNLTPISFDDNLFLLKTDLDFFKTTINQRYLHDIANSLRIVTGKDVEVRVLSPEDYKRKEPIRDENRQSSSQSNIRNKYDFESFVKGKSNELAYAAAVAVAEAPGRTTYNPLFVYGGVGLGKTHLMHSIGNYILKNYPGTQVLYVSSETFTNEFINSIKRNTNQEFRNKYRQIDVLLIDDIQFLSEKEGTQEELFHTFNTLYNENKQIVLSSDLPPKEIKTLEDRLRSRFGMGLIVDITMPDFETRMAILEKKAETDHLVISKEVTTLIAKNIVSNIRDLEGALNKVAAYAKLSNNQISIELAEKAIRDLVVENEKPEINVEYIQSVVADYYGLTPEDLRNKKRTQNIVYPRQIAMYLSRKLIDISLPLVGQKFGGRDHSTVIHGCDKITNELEHDSNLRNVLIELERRIKE